MTFLANIPQAADRPSNSQGQLLANNQTLYTAFNRNHIDLDDGIVANRGKHKSCVFVDGGDFATAANEMALYGKAVGGISTLFMRKESNGTIIQLSGPDPVIASPGTTFLPGGIIIQWGHAVSNTGAEIVFATMFPNACWVVVASGEANDAAKNSINTFTKTQTGFWARDDGSWGFDYIAIGN